MKNKSKTKAQLVRELAQMRRRLADLEALEARREQVEPLLPESQRSPSGGEAHPPQVAGEMLDLAGQRRLFESLMAMMRAIAEGPTLEMMLNSALNAAAIVTYADYGDLFLLDVAGAVTHYIQTPRPAMPERHQNVIASAQQPAQDSLQGTDRLDKGLAGWVARHCQAAMIADTSQDKRWQDLPDNSYRARSALSAPILSGPALVGVLTLAHSQPNHFTLEHLQLLQITADQVAVAIRQAQISEEQRRMTDRQITLNEVLRAVSGWLDPDTVARLAVDAISKYAGWPEAAVIVPDESGAHWVILAASTSPLSPVGMKYPIDRGVVGRAFRMAKTQYVPDVSVDPDYLTGQPDTRSELAVPVRRGERVLGVLDLEDDQLAAFNSDDILLAESLAEAIALALENARLYTQAQRHAADLGALYAITRATSRSLAVEDVLDRALSSVTALLGFRGGMLVLADPDDGRLRVAAARGLPPALLEHLRREGLEGTLAAYVHCQRETLLIRESPQEAPAEVRPSIMAMAAQGWRAHAGIPLLHQEQSLGAMWLVAQEPHQPSTYYELALLTTIGQQVATAVTNARLFQTALGQRGRLQALIKSSRDGIVLSGADGRIQVINTPALQLLHLPGDPEEWLNRSLKDTLAVLRIFAPSVVRIALAELRRFRKGDQSPTEGEYELSPHVIHWQSLPVLVGNTPQGRLVALRDVTDERAVERLREDMTHTMVHDLRNPLWSISASLEMLGDGTTLGPVSTDQHELLDLAQASTRRMIDLVNAILDVSRLESGQMPLAQQAFSLVALVTQTLQAQTALASEKNIRLENDVPLTLPLAWADVSIIGRVLQNLVGNAIKFTPPEGVVRVTARTDAAQRAERVVILVDVSDTGPGIPTEIQGRLFQKFVAGRQQGRGSGLGLAFCKLALEAHGERISVASVPEHGTTFTFSLATAKDASGTVE